MARVIIITIMIIMGIIIIMMGVIIMIIIYEDKRALCFLSAFLHCAFCDGDYRDYRSVFVMGMITIIINEDKRLLCPAGGSFALSCCSPRCEILFPTPLHHQFIQLLFFYIYHEKTGGRLLVGGPLGRLDIVLCAHRVTHEMDCDLKVALPDR